LNSLFSTEKYTIDTSALTQGWRKYPPKVFSSLWNEIGSLIIDGVLIAPDEVKQELKVGGDDLYKWCNKFSGFFLPIDPDVQNANTKILGHPEHRKLINLKTPSIYCADSWVIATAQVRDLIVISEEVIMQSPSPYKTKIPNVCKDLKIDHFSFLEFVIEQNWSF
jgi:hypothetical protein